ncbi:MAG: thioredoxin family protein [Bacteroidetes bacterium]|nr:thioredoxin family protein [Bacteroidota bacterium]
MQFRAQHLIKYSLIILLLTLCSTISASSQGINFLKTNLQGAFESAKRANKILFVEVYLNGCPHCAALAPVLEEKKVGDFYNNNFISVKIEANSDDSRYLQQQKNLTYVEFPMFFFFDPVTGQSIHQASPGERPNRAEAIEEVLTHGKDAITPNQRTNNYPNRYAQGDRGMAFLINYCRYAKAHKNDKLVAQINNDLAKIIVKPEDLESKVAFYIIQRLINDFDNPIAVYFFKNLDKYKAKYPAKDVTEAGEVITYYTLYGYRGNELDALKIAQIRQAMVKVGIAKDLASSRTVLKELEALFRVKDTKKATDRLNEHRKIAKLTIQDYAYLTRFFNEKATDNSYISSLLAWVKDGLQTVKPNERNRQEVAELYLEQGKAYLKIGKKTEAQQSLQEALKIAKAAKIDTKNYTNELARSK